MVASFDLKGTQSCGFSVNRLLLEYAYHKGEFFQSSKIEGHLRVLVSLFIDKLCSTARY